METTNNTATVISNNAKVVARHAANAGLYTAEKPLVGMAILLRATAATIGAMGTATMMGAVKLHTSRKGEESAKAMVNQIDNGFAMVENKVDATFENISAKASALRDKIEAAKAKRKLASDEKAEEAAIQLLLNKGYTVK